MQCWLFFFIGDSFRCLEEAAWERDSRGWARLTQKTKKAEPLDSDELACPGAYHSILRGTPPRRPAKVGATPVSVAKTFRGGSRPLSVLSALPYEIVLSYLSAITHIATPPWDRPSPRA